MFWSPPKDPGAAECGRSSKEVPPDLYQRLRSISLEEARLIIQRIDRKYIDQEAIGGGTLTTWSAEFHRPGIIEFLLELGADPCLKESYAQKTALQWAEDTPPNPSPALRDATIQVLRKAVGLVDAVEVIHDEGRGVEKEKTDSFRKKVSFAE